MSLRPIPALTPVRRGLLQAIILFTLLHVTQSATDENCQVPSDSLNFCMIMRGRKSQCGGAPTRAMDTQAHVLYSLLMSRVPNVAMRESKQCQEALTAVVCANSFPSCDVASSCSQNSGTRMHGVSAEMCYEYMTKCGLPEFECRDPNLWVQPGSGLPSTDVDLDPQVSCRVPWGQLHFCSKIRYPVLAAPFGTADSYAMRDTEAKTWYEKISTKLDTEQCKQAKKNLACSVSLPECNKNPISVKAVCASACSDVLAKCGESVFCGNATSYAFTSDDGDCAMYSKEPIASRVVITVLAVLLVLLFLSITLVLVKVFVLRKMLPAYRYENLNTYDIDEAEGIELPYAGKM